MANEVLDIVIVDDIRTDAEALKTCLLRHRDSRYVDSSIRILTEPRSLISDLEQQTPDLLFLDLSFGDVKVGPSTGLKLLREIRRHSDIRHVAVIAVTVSDDENEQEQLLANGVDGFISKGQDRDDERWVYLSEIISRSCKTSKLRKEHWGEFGVFKKGGRNKHADVNLFGTSMAMIQTFCTLFRISSAEPDLTVLITGRPGTGKTSFGRAIHALGGRHNKELVEVIIAHTPSTLLPSELFGIEAKVATGVQVRTGLLTQANNGTVLLDEVADLEPPDQILILKVLRDGMIRPLGRAGEISVDFQVICATNKNLERLVETNKFREDLYHRIRGYPLHIPSLRERLDSADDDEGASREFGLLINLELRRLAKEIKRPALNPFHEEETYLSTTAKPGDAVPKIHPADLPRPFEFTDAAWRHLLGHTWPGNYAELRTLLRELALLDCTRVNREMVDHRIMKCRQTGDDPQV